MRKLHLGFFGISYLLSFFSVSLWAKSSSPSATLPSSAFRFSLEPRIGSPRIECEHFVEDELTHDWRVVCGRGTPVEASFVVHALVRRWQPEGLQPASFEIIYDLRGEAGLGLDWEPLPDGASNTTWVHFDRLGDLPSILINQPVAEDSARLWLEIRPESAAR